MHNCSGAVVTTEEKGKKGLRSFSKQLYSSVNGGATYTEVSPNMTNRIGVMASSESDSLRFCQTHTQTGSIVNIPHWDQITDSS